VELFSEAEIAVLAVKPQVFGKLAGEWMRALAGFGGKTVLSVMAGVRVEKMRDVFPPSFAIIRVMPNLGLAVGEGATAIACDGLAEESLKLAETVFGASGKTVRVVEAQMDAVTGLSGSGPMYAFEFIEALTQGGVQCGLPRETAYALALQTLRGSLKLLETSEDAPPAWTRRVCSPGGTTEQGLRVLNEKGFPSLLAEAVKAATARSQELSG
jgi:pyrroline-5-carboxylate reductase